MFKICWVCRSHICHRIVLEARGAVSLQHSKFGGGFQHQNMVQTLIAIPIILCSSSDVIVDWHFVSGFDTDCWLPSSFGSLCLYTLSHFILSGCCPMSCFEEKHIFVLKFRFIFPEHNLKSSIFPSQWIDKKHINIVFPQFFPFQATNCLEISKVSQFPHLRQFQEQKFLHSDSWCS